MTQILRSSCKQWLVETDMGMPCVNGSKLWG